MRRGIRAVKPVRYAARGKYINGTIGNQLTGHMLACTLTAPRRATVLRPWVGTATLVREADMVMADILVCTVCRRFGVCGNGDPRPRKSRFLHEL